MASQDRDKTDRRAARSLKPKGRRRAYRSPQIQTTEAFEAVASACCKGPIPIIASTS